MEGEGLRQGSDGDQTHMKPRKAGVCAGDHVAAEFRGTASSDFRKVTLAKMWEDGSKEKEV